MIPISAFLCVQRYLYTPELCNKDEEKAPNIFDLSTADPKIRIIKAQLETVPRLSFSLPVRTSSLDRGPGHMIDGNPILHDDGQNTECWKRNTVYSYCMGLDFIE